MEPCHGRLSSIEVFPSWKTKYLNYYITIIETCCKKDGCHERQACFMDIERAVSPQECIFWTSGLGI